MVLSPDFSMWRVAINSVQLRLNALGDLVFSGSPIRAKAATMKKRVPPSVIVLVVAIVIGICAFLYNRAPLEPVPPKDAKPIQLDFNPHKMKAEKLKAQTDSANTEKALKAIKPSSGKAEDPSESKAK